MVLDVHYSFTIKAWPEVCMVDTTLYYIWEGAYPVNRFSAGLLDHLFSVQIHDVFALLQKYNETQVQILQMVTYCA